MPIALDELLDGVKKSRRYLLRHVKDLPEAAWNWKPYPECKSVLETLAHLRVDDMMAAESIQTLAEPEYEKAVQAAYPEMAAGHARLLYLLDQSHTALLDLIREKFAGVPLDTEICVWGTTMPLYRGVPYFSSEDFYHAGQIAFVRMAVQPDWDYYGAIYGDVDH